MSGMSPLKLSTARNEKLPGTFLNKLKAQVLLENDDILINECVKNVQNMLKSLISDDISPEDGATLVEYALLVSLVALISLLGISSMGESLSLKFEDQALIIEKPELASKSKACLHVPEHARVPHCN